MATTVHVTLNDRQLLGSLIMAVPTRIALKLSGVRAPDEVKAYTSTLPPAFNRTLSIALAMKGGVSLAVWIGGAVSELDILRRIRIVRTAAGARRAYFLADPGTRRDPNEKNGPPMDAAAFDSEQFQTLLRADAYARLLVSRGYDGVDIDVLAGASAGGLNAVLYGVAQRAGVSVDPLLSTWTESGSAWKLLRTPGFLSVPSLLRGDDFFWPQVMGAIDGFYGWTGNAETVTPEITVDLSATISDRKYLSAAGSHEGRGHFHFLGAEPDSEAAVESAVTRFDPALGRSIPTIADDASVARLAYAARTTSSFPGAFEQARIWSHPATMASFEPAESVDMSFAFSAHRPGVDDEPAVPFQVLDGGVLDNIPIDRLTRAIRDRTPRDYGDRIAIYLDPSPDAVPLSARTAVASSPPRVGRQTRAERGKQSFLGTVGNGIFMRGIRESADDEIEAIDEQRQAALYETARAGSYAQSVQRLLPPRPAASGPALAAWRSRYYILYRAISDADLLKRVLGDPNLWQLTTDLDDRSSWPVTPDALLRRLDEQLEVEYSRIASETAGRTTGDRGARIVEGPQGIRDAALCALDWMRDLEDFAVLRGSTAAFDAERGELRRRIHLVARDALRLRDERTRFVLNQLTLQGLAAPTADFAQSFGSMLAANWLALDPSDARPGLLWGRLGAALVELRSYTTQLEVVLSGLPADEQDWGSPWRWFPPTGDATSLAPFIAAEGIPDIVQLQQFAVISAAESTPFQAAFSPLVAAQRAEIVSRWLALSNGRFLSEAQVSELDTLPLDPGAKLAGSTLANFGAFFARVWRVNDWWWGRLDAASGIVRVLASLPGDAVDPELTTLLQSAVLRQATRAQIDNRPFKKASELGDAPPGQIAAQMSAGAHTLTQLAPSYLVSVASRAVRIAVRAVRSGQNIIVKTGATAVLPPLLAVVPLVFAPVRLIFLISAMFAILPWAAGPPHLDPAAFGPATLPGWALLLAAFAVSAFPLFGVVTSWHRIRLLRVQDAATQSERTLPILEPLIRRSRVSSLILSAIAAAALIVLAVRDALALQVDASSVFLALGAVAAAFGARSASRTLAKKPLFVETVLFGLMTVAAVVAIFAPQLIAAPMAVLSDPGHVLHLANGAPTVIVGLALGLVQAVLSWGWLGGFGDPRRVIGLIHWVLGIAVVVAATSGIVYWISLGQGGAAVPGLVTGLAVWFVASQLGWWIGELPLPLVADIDEPRF